MHLPPMLGAWGLIVCLYNTNVYGNSMKKAAMVVGTNVWTMTYEINKSGSLTILDFNPEDPDGYILPDTMIARLQSVSESEGRVAETVTIDNVVYDVENKQNIYTYRQPLNG